MAVQVRIAITENAPGLIAVVVPALIVIIPSALVSIVLAAAALIVTMDNVLALFAVAALAQTATTDSALVRIVVAVLVRIVTAAGLSAAARAQTALAALVSTVPVLDCFADAIVRFAVRASALVVAV
jgi:hypothetical protein